MLSPLLPRWWRPFLPPVRLLAYLCVGLGSLAPSATAQSTWLFQPSPTPTWDPPLSAQEAPQHQAPSDSTDSIVDELPLYDPQVLEGEPAPIPDDEESGSPIFQLDLQQQIGVTDSGSGEGTGNGSLIGPGTGQSGDAGIAPGLGTGTGLGFPPASADPLNAATQKNGPTITGLIVDARGLDFQPSVSMRLFDPSGNQIYTTPTANQELNTYYVASEGTAAYATSEAQAKSLTQRIGSRPHLIRAQKTLGYDLVISNEDAWMLSLQNQSDKFLDNFAVVVIWDPASAKLP
ncbi:MAG: hypothetical protein NW237_14380 [Cyanobacteriota bacterium]|nr:hypothetical protein [Cyanobacteriota bacterium]